MPVDAVLAHPRHHLQHHPVHGAVHCRGLRAHQERLAAQVVRQGLNINNVIKVKNC